MFAKFKLLPLMFLSLISCSIAFASPAPAAAAAAGGQGYGQTIRCSSDDGKRHYCNMDTRGGVSMTRQVSGSACIQGQTWGYDNRGVWVDRGCRADFTSGRGNGGPGWGNGGGGGQAVTCSSNNGGRNYCSMNTSGGVRLSRQISGSACVQGQSWGYDNRGVWVDRGCRAEFVSGRGNGGIGGPGWGNGGGGYETITCSSDNGSRNYCSIPNNRGNNVILTRQISGSACIQNQTWGVDRRGLWVDRGCRAEFRVNR